MMLLAFLTVLANGIVNVPASGWQAIAIEAPEDGGTVEIAFVVQQGSRVQVFLADPAEAARFHRGRSPDALAMTGFVREGSLRQRIHRAGRYIVVVDNRIEGRRPAQVQLKIDFSPPVNVVVRELSPERRRAVVAISILVFGATVFISARLLLRNTGGFRL